MTVKYRLKNCIVCGDEFRERAGDSNKQWEGRSYCSMSCNNKSPRRVVSIFDRLKRHQVIKDGCWGWSAAKDGAGYGIISNRNGSSFSPEKAHRVSYEFVFGDIPLGMNICHKCDNPECTNPDHLFAGTQKDNMKDCSDKGRLSSVSLKNLSHDFVLSEADAELIKSVKFASRNGRGGVTVKSIAKKLGVSAATISKVKNGRYK